MSLVAQAKTPLNTRNLIGVLAALAVMALFYLLPPFSTLTVQGKNVLGLLVAALILWVTEAVPLTITSVILIAVQPILGVASLTTAFNKFVSPVFFFVFASFGISVAIMKTPLAARFTKWMLKYTRNESKYVILALMIATSIVSGLVSNVPTTALFMGLSLPIIAAAGGREKADGLARCLMIGVPFAAMIGGISTPAGSSINILTLFLLDQVAHVQITFVEWMGFGIPVFIVLLPITWYMLIKVFKPTPIPAGVLEAITADVPEKMTGLEKKLLIIVGLMVALWIISSWVPQLNITLIALLGLVVMFLPGIDLLEWDEFNQGVGWDVMFMIGGVTSIAAAVVETGLGKWLVDTSLAGFAGWNIVALTLAVAMLINVLHLVLPNSTAVVAVTIPPLCGLAAAAGINPAIFALATAFLSGCCTMLPLDAVPLITFSKRYYTMWDMFKVGLPTSLVWVILTGVWVPILAAVIY